MVSLSKYRGTTRHRYRTFKVSKYRRITGWFIFNVIPGANPSIDFSIQRHLLLFFNIIGSFSVRITRAVFAGLTFCSISSRLRSCSVRCVAESGMSTDIALASRSGDKHPSTTHNQSTLRGRPRGWTLRGRPRSGQRVDTQGAATQRSERHRNATSETDNYYHYYAHLRVADMTWLTCVSLMPWKMIMLV